MDGTALIVTIGGGVLICLTLWFFFGNRPGRKRGADSSLYACPMHPWVTSTDPGADCSICGMKLVRDEGGAGRPPA
jgi:hypothetical protein